MSCLGMGLGIVPKHTYFLADIFIDLKVSVTDTQEKTNAAPEAGKPSLHSLIPQMATVDKAPPGSSQEHETPTGPPT